MRVCASRIRIGEYGTAGCTVNKIEIESKSKIENRNGNRDRDKG